MSESRRAVVVKRLNSLEASSLSSLGKTIFNTNGRAYLLQAAAERSGALNGRSEEKPSLSDALIDAIPIDLFFEVMATRLRPELSIESHESALFKIGPHSYIVTIRKGVAEIIKGDKPLYGTPDLIGTHTPPLHEAFANRARGMSMPLEITLLDLWLLGGSI